MENVQFLQVLQYYKQGLKVPTTYLHVLEGGEPNCYSTGNSEVPQQVQDYGHGHVDL